ncbi:MAG: tripartite tricarboxylate transporter TctB family protein [Desulfobacteraceae bacterium]|nr:MAG: tripartite tricarboxylate transporter TctB family protein [Desulfobacteraceae bacterium]
MLCRKAQCLKINNANRRFFKEEKSLRNWDITCTILLLLFGLYVVVTGWHLGFGSFDSPGTGFIAVFSGLFLSVFSVTNLAFSIASYRKTDDQSFWPQPDSWKKVLAILAGPIAFTLLLNYAGFFICTLAMLIYLFRAIHPHRMSLTLVLAITAAVFCLVLFQLILKVQFPEGLIGLYRIKGWLN